MSDIPESQYQQAIGEDNVATGDIIFILLFIVLPTTVIVSGFWVILFVARNPERSTVPPATGNSIDDSAADLNAESPAADGVLVTAQEATGHVPTADEVVPQTIDELNPVAADLLAEEEARRQEIAATSPREDEHAEDPSALSSESDSTKISPTEEIPEIADPMLVDLTSEEPGADDGDKPLDSRSNIVQIDTWRTGSQHLDSPDETVQPNSEELANMTVELNELEEHSEKTAASPVDESSEDGLSDRPDPETSDGMTANLADLDDVDSDSLPTPSKKTLLVPSRATERKNRRNSRSSGRQVPQISRSIRRDESVVERGDSVSNL